MTPVLERKPLFAHIQILRAIAVVMVVGFHMGWPGFSFGYLGVDIFFVISGFLMFQIYSELESNRVRSFYFRRLKRLLPAYLFVSLATTLIFFLVVLPFERVSLVTQNLYANFLISNFYYWTENQYFISGGLRPLLTFWSLALELQFYLIFPIIFIIVKKYKQLFFLIILFSALLHILLNMISPETAFFLLPARLWEFLIGTAIAVNMNSQIANKYFRPKNFSFIISFNDPNGGSISICQGHTNFLFKFCCCGNYLIFTKNRFCTWRKPGIYKKNSLDSRKILILDLFSPLAHNLPYLLSALFWKPQAWYQPKT